MFYTLPGSFHPSRALLLCSISRSPAVHSGGHCQSVCGVCQGGGGGAVCRELLRAPSLALTGGTAESLRQKSREAQGASERKESRPKGERHTLTQPDSLMCMTQAENPSEPQAVVMGNHVGRTGVLVSSRSDQASVSQAANTPDLRWN